MNGPAIAQNKLWTLEECIQHAIDNNIELKQRELAQKNQEVLLNTSKNSWLPNLNGGIGQDFSFGRSLVDDNTYVNTNTSYSSVYLRLSMPLFDGFYIKNDIGARQLDLLAAVENLNKAKEDLAINVTYYYLQVLYNKEILKIATLQVGLTNEQVARTEALVNAGKVPLSQLYDIKAQLAQDEVTLAEASNNVNLSLLDLAQALELERVEETFDIQTPDMEDAIGKYLGSILPPDDVYDYAVAFKPQIKEQEYLVESQKKALKVAQSGYYPKLDIGASYGTNYYYYYGDELAARNINFSDQIKNNQNKTIGLSLTIPLFNRFQVRNNIRSARLAILNQQLIMDNTKKYFTKRSSRLITIPLLLRKNTGLLKSRY